MVTVPAPNPLDFGVPHSDSETYTRTNPQLFNDESPRLRQTLMVAFSTTIVAYQVVGLSGGKVVPATWDADPEDAIQPIGVAVFGATNDADDTREIVVWRTGHFNADALVWGATFDTYAKKRLAFEGAPSPTQIFISRVITGAPV